MGRLGEKGWNFSGHVEPFVEGEVSLGMAWCNAKWDFGAAGCERIDGSLYLKVWTEYLGKKINAWIGKLKERGSKFCIELCFTAWKWDKIKLAWQRYEMKKT